MKENISNGSFKGGEKLMSENKLCETFSISRQTARQAIAILEKDGLVVKRQGSGTYINSSTPPQKKRLNCIGILTPDLTDPLSATLITSIESVLSQNGYQINLKITRHKVNSEREHLLSLLAADIDGLIVEGTKSALPNPNLDLYQQFAQQNIPVIFVRNYYPSLDCNYIVVDHELGGQMATRHLIEKGHHNITGIFKYDDLQGSLRYKGFLSEMYKHHLSVDESTMIWISSEDMNQSFDDQNLNQILKKIKQSSALICHSDQIALKISQLLTRSKMKVPLDLSLISFDNSSLSTMGTITLTSLTHPTEEMGKLAAESILTMIKTPHYEIKHVYTPDLMIRESVELIK